MIAPLSEKAFTQMVIYAFRYCGWLCYHTFDSRRSEPGFPDIVAVHPERGTIFAELKMPRGKVSAAQETWIERLRLSGQRVYLWRPDDWDEIEGVANGTVDKILAGEDVQL